eukprot:5385707-Pleurochrysis_carterae.AAC.1
MPRFSEVRFCGQKASRFAAQRDGRQRSGWWRRRSDPPLSLSSSASGTSKKMLFRLPTATAMVKAPVGFTPRGARFVKLSLILEPPGRASIAPVLMVSRQFLLTFVLQAHAFCTWPC